MQVFPTMASSSFLIENTRGNVKFSPGFHDCLLKSQFGSWGKLGAADMPDVVAELEVIGKWIKSQPHTEA